MAHHYLSFPLLPQLHPNRDLIFESMMDNRVSQWCVAHVTVGVSPVCHSTLGDQYSESLVSQWFQETYESGL